MLRSRSASASRTRGPIRVPEQQHHRHHEYVVSSGSARPDRPRLSKKPLVNAVFLPVLILLLLILLGLFCTTSPDTFTFTSTFVFRRTDPVARLIQQRLSERAAPNTNRNDASSTTTTTATIRVFGPDTVDAAAWASSATGTTTQTAVPPPPPPLPPVPRVLSSSSSDKVTITMELYNRDQQRDFLQQFGSYCQPAPAPQDEQLQQHQQQRSSNLLLEAFDQLAEEYGRELWKYCVLYTGLGNVYLESENTTPLVTWSDLLMTSTATSSTASSSSVMGNRALAVESSDAVDDWSFGASRSNRVLLHHSFLQVANPKSQVCGNMIRYLLETSTSMLTPINLSETLGIHVTNDDDEHEQTSSWTLLPTRCLWAGDPSGSLHKNESERFQQQQSQSQSSQGLDHAIDRPCPLAHGYCCQVWQERHVQAVSMVVMAIRHPFVTRSGPPTPPSLPFATTTSSTNQGQSRLVTAPSDLPYIATLREERLVAADTSPRAQFETPNFFDILIENDCLPESKECFKCLKRGSKLDDERGGDCTVCRDVCLCYCSALCSIRPPPKLVVAEMQVQRPIYRKDPGRLIPRIIHQTWYEPVEEKKYPNMSRLTESWKQSGWEYRFYDDETSANFLSTHFPPQVREAYDAITPGAFKADLFRYCVLLIHGGIYADMDIMLESNLDQVIAPNVGFVTAQDEPGQAIGHRSCLWNGFLASAPGHPFLARTIENVVNNIRNRFTSVDYDDMLCPNPVLSVSHTVDTLFTCGPCILGASINDVLGRHRQTGFDFGEIDLYAVQSGNRENDQDVQSSGTINGVNGNGNADVESDDPRLLVPGRTILLQQNKDDMGAHRFTLTESNLVVASTDLPDYDDRPPTYQHYSKTHESFGIYGLPKQEASLYVNEKRANEEIRFRVLIRAWTWQEAEAGASNSAGSSGRNGSVTWPGERDIMSCHAVRCSSIHCNSGRRVR